MKQRGAVVRHSKMIQVVTIFDYGRRGRTNSNWWCSQNSWRIGWHAGRFECSVHICNGQYDICILKQRQSERVGVETYFTRAGTGCLSEYRLYCGKNQSIYWTAAVYWPSEASNAERSLANSPPQLVGGARWRRRRRPKQYAFSLHFPSQSGLKTVLTGGRCGHLHRTNPEKKSQEKYMQRVAWCDVLHVGVGAGAL